MRRVQRTRCCDTGCATWTRSFFCDLRYIALNGLMQFLGFVQQSQSACSACEGSGEVIPAKDRCQKCNGRKKVGLN